MRLPVVLSVGVMGLVESVRDGFGAGWVVMTVTGPGGGGRPGGSSRLD